MWPDVLNGSCLSAPTKMVKSDEQCTKESVRGANLVVAAFELESLLGDPATHAWTDAQLLAATS